MKIFDTFSALNSKDFDWRTEGDPWVDRRQMVQQMPQLGKSEEKHSLEHDVNVVVAQKEPWSPQDLAKVVRLAETGHSDLECATLIGRTVPFIHSKLKWLRGGRNETTEQYELMANKVSNAILDQIRSNDDFLGT